MDADDDDENVGGGCQTTGCCWCWSCAARLLPLLLAASVTDGDVPATAEVMAVDTVLLETTILVGVIVATPPLPPVSDVAVTMASGGGPAAM